MSPRSTSTVGVAGLKESRAALWIDVDNDGWLDLGVINNFPVPSAYTNDASRLFLGSSSGVFTEISAAAGFVSALYGRGLIAFDADQDGDLDLLETNFSGPAWYYRNDTPAAGNWLGIDLLAAGGRRYAPGAEIRLSGAGWQHVVLASVGSSLLSQEPYRQHIGLGPVDQVASLTVRWPDGTVDGIEGVDVNQRVRIAQHQGLLPTADATADGTVNGADAAWVIDCLMGPAKSTGRGREGADLNFGGRVDLRDVAILTAALVGP